MASETHILTPDDPGWDACIGRTRHDFYHLASYHALAERAGEGRPRMVVHTEGPRFLAWPYLLRGLDEGRTDATSVYGYTGPVGRGLDDSAFLASAWTACRAVWADQGLVTLFTRFHPLLGNHGSAAAFRGAASPPGGELLRYGRTVSIDLSLDRDERRALYPQPLRQDVKRAERRGLSVIRDEDWAHAKAFGRLYRRTMERNAAAERYLFSDAYLSDLRQAMRGIGHLAVALHEGDVAGALVFTVHGPLASAHLTGTDPRFKRLSPLKALIDLTCDLARDLGAEVLHLGAGRGGEEDSLFDFKARFSPNRHGFVAGRWILDANAHARLAAKSGAEDDGRFFPIYRRPDATAGAA